MLAFGYFVELTMLTGVLLETYISLIWYLMVLMTYQILSFNDHLESKVERLLSTNKNLVAQDNTVLGKENIKTGQATQHNTVLVKENIEIGLAAQQNSILSNENIEIGLTAQHDTILAKENIETGLAARHHIIFAKENLKIGLDAQPNTILGKENIEIGVIVTQNTSLKQQYDEVKHKNEISPNTFDLKKNKNPSCADVIKPNTIKNSKVPNISIIGKSINADNKTIFSTVSDLIRREIKVPVRGVFNTKKNGTVIKCLNAEDIPTASRVLKSKLGDDFEVTLQETHRPRLKIFGIASEMDKTELEEDINERNFHQFGSKCEVLHIFKCTNNNNGAIIQLPSDLHEYVVSNKYRICISTQCLKSFDDIVSLCFKCAGFNHSSKKCTNDCKCIYCAGDHMAKDCNNQGQAQCANCSYANKNFKCEYKTNHIASDTLKCEILKKKINVTISNTDYITKPIIPQFLIPVKSSNNATRDNTSQEQCKSSTSEIITDESVRKNLNLPEKINVFKPVQKSAEETNLNYGYGAEARLRQGEVKSSARIVPISEGRIRVQEQRYSSSLEANMTKFSLKNYEPKKLPTAASNPFEDDYDDTKNPFKENEDLDENNPFRDDFDCDKNLNPFS